jgi:hypothetical protein
MSGAASGRDAHLIWRRTQRRGVAGGLRESACSGGATCAAKNIRRQLAALRHLGSVAARRIWRNSTRRRRRHRGESGSGERDIAAIND